MSSLDERRRDQGRPERTAMTAGTLVRAALALTFGVLLLSLLQGGAIVVTAAATRERWSAVLVSVVLVAALSALWSRRWHARFPSLSRGSATAALILVVSLFSACAYLLPARVEPIGAPEANLRLLDGTALAVRNYGDAARSRIALVAVPGGPGVPWSRAEESFLASLATIRPVVVYDQIGTGRSDRLPDPRGYTLQRAVDDLARVVDATPERRVHLLGYSWGATVATAYAAQQPEHVASLTLLSPGAFPLHGKHQQPGRPQNRLTWTGRLGVYARGMSPRNLFVYSLTAVDPRVAHLFASDAEMDRRFDAMYRATAGGLTCDGLPPADSPARLGFYASQVPQLHPDPRGDIRPEDLRVLSNLPVLILRGSCDYLPPAVADEYRQHFPRARFVAMQGGHALIDEDPVHLRAHLDGFLAAMGNG